jgi:[ribosomal protein S5]-alanine N-acetyltransferase
MQPTYHIETARLILREFTHADAPYMLRQLNEPSFIENIADRGVRTLAQAERYLENGPLASYQLNGFGFWAVVEKSSGEIIGMCGLVKRPSLDYVDLGYAFLPGYTGQGYAFEAGQACTLAAQRDFALPRLLAIVNPGNMASRRLLEKLAFAFARMQTVHDDEPALCVYQRELLAL